MFLSLLAKRKDFIHIKIKMVAVTNIINFELPAQILANGSDPVTKLRKKSNHQRKIEKCIQFFNDQDSPCATVQPTS